MSRYKGIIFDLDGTLIDTIEDLSNSVNEMLEGYGYPVFSCGEYKQKVGWGFRSLMENSLPAGVQTEEMLEQAQQKFAAIYGRRYMEHSVPYPGIVPMLDELNRRKIRLAVNSNKRDDYTKKLILKFFSGIPFVEIYGERAGVPKKPDPSAALAIAGLMQLSPAEILYIGDSATDMQTGKNAGMDTVGVTWGFRSRSELQKNGAVYLADNTDEIIRLLV